MITDTLLWRKYSLMSRFFRTFVLTKISTLQNTRETSRKNCNTGLDFFKNNVFKYFSIKHF